MKAGYIESKERLKGVAEEGLIEGITYRQEFKRSFIIFALSQAA